MSDRAEKSARRRAEKAERQRLAAVAAFETVRVDAETKAWARGRERGWMEVNITTFTASALANAATMGELLAAVAMRAAAGQAALATHRSTCSDHRPQQISDEP